jgi:hypothetical protein
MSATTPGRSAVSERGDRRDSAGVARRETSHERLDRNLVELTGELRVVITGVQVLFAFLLVVAFERTVYFITLLCAAWAAIFTIAPAAQHRILFRRDDKAHLVFSGSGLTIAGLTCLALAMCGALLLVATVLFGELAGVVTALAMGVPFGALWFAIPLLRARHDAERDARR